MVGINVDPLNPGGRPEPLRLREQGITWVRLVSREACRSYVELCQITGLMVLAVVARESAGDIMGGIADIYQIGNEPDHLGPSSWTMTVKEYREEWRIYRETYPDLIMIAAGLASGHTNWWRQVQQQGGLAGCSGLAIHPYNKTATEARTLISEYQAITPGMPVWITEWHRPKEQVAEFRAMLDHQPGLVGHAWFCWSSEMVEGFGLTPHTQRILTA